MEHLLYPDLYIDTPRFLIVLEKNGQEVAVYGGYIITEQRASEGILFRATQLMRCSMVDPELVSCTARLVCEFGVVQFSYQTETFSYAVEKHHTIHSSEACQITSE